MAPVAGPPEPDEEVEQPGLARVLGGFTVAYMFDESQTDGPSPPELRPPLLRGAAPAGLWDALADQVRSAASASTGPAAPRPTAALDFAARTVSVRADLEPSSSR